MLDCLPAPILQLDRADLARGYAGTSATGHHGPRLHLDIAADVLQAQLVHVRADVRDRLHTLLLGQPASTATCPHPEPVALNGQRCPLSCLRLRIQDVHLVDWRLIIRATLLLLHIQGELEGVTAPDAHISC